MLGREPSLAKELAISVNHYHYILEDGVAVGEDDEVKTTEPPPPYTFIDTNMTLGNFHKMSQGSVKINIKECMTYLTANTDLNAISND